MYDCFFHIVSLERIRPLTHISGCTNRIPLQPTTLDPTVQSLFKKKIKEKFFALFRYFVSSLAVSLSLQTSEKPHHLTNSREPFFPLSVSKCWPACRPVLVVQIQQQQSRFCVVASEPHCVVCGARAHWMRDSCQGLHARKKTLVC